MFLNGAISVRMAEAPEEAVASVGTYLADTAEAATAAVNSSSKSASNPLRRLRLEAQMLQTTADRVAAGGVNALSRALEHAHRLSADWNDLVVGTDLSACQDPVDLGLTAQMPPVQPVAIAVTCVVDPDFIEKLTGNGPWAPADATAPCDKEHDYEAFASVGLPSAPGMDYPGEIALAQYAVAQCRNRFESLPPEINRRRDISYSGQWPSAQAWDAGSRGVACVLYDLTGNALKPPTLRQ